MFCKFCGRKIPEKLASVGFCPFCGETLTERQNPNPEMSRSPERPPTEENAAIQTDGRATTRRNPRTLVKVSLAIVGILLLLAILARVGQQNPPQQTVPARAEPLPLQPSDLLSTYNPRPKLIAVTDKGTGHAVETYQGKFHKLELEEEDGQLVRAAMIFDKSEVTNNLDAGVAAAFSMGIFVMKTGRIKDNLKGRMEQLGLNDAWSPSPSQIVVNGVEIRRYMEGSSLILQAVAAGTARVTSAAGEPHAESSQACSIADEPHISWKIQQWSDSMKKEDRIFGWTFSHAVIPRQVPRGSVEKRPTGVSAKPANGCRPEQDVFIVCWPVQASLIC
jgi:hypothetical protein